jgi:hypothetical protein
VFSHGLGRDAPKADDSVGEGFWPAYSVEKLHGTIWLKYSKASESLKFERAQGPQVSEDIPAQAISKRPTAYLCLIFSHELIRGRNRRCAGN